MFQAACLVVQLRTLWPHFIVVDPNVAREARGLWRNSFGFASSIFEGVSKCFSEKLCFQVCGLHFEGCPAKKTSFSSLQLALFERCLVKKFNFELVSSTVEGSKASSLSFQIPRLKDFVVKIRL